MDEQDKVLRKIQALVDKAHGGTTDAEAAACLAKADELMVRYSVENFQLLDPKRATTARGVTYDKPEVRDIIILDVESATDLDRYMMLALSRIFQSVAQHLFIKVGSISYKESRVVGYPVDLRFFEMFFLKLKMQMFSEMIVKVDPEGDWVAQVAGLKNMGYKWEQVHYRMQGHPDYPAKGMPWSKQAGSKFIGKVNRYFKDNDVPRNTSSNPAAWRQDYVDGYAARISERLYEMRRATMEANPLLPDLLEGKKSEVMEAYYEAYPDRRPHPPECECENCHYQKCNNQRCQRTICVNARKPVRYGATRYRVLNGDARNAGRSAANRADLTDKGPIG